VSITRSYAYDATPNAMMQSSPCSSSLASENNYKFTGKERDAESGLDNFDFRYYSSSLGRFMKPDQPLLWWDQNDPQTLNLYSYVRNNPLSGIDPDGHDCVYLNDAGNGVESIDHNSSAGECTGNNNGGYWVPGYVANSSWVTSIDSENGAIGAYSASGGSFSFTASTNNAYGVDFTSVKLPSDREIMADMIPGGRGMLAFNNWAGRALPIVNAYSFFLFMKAGGEGEGAEEEGAGEAGEGAAEIPGHPFTGPNAARDAFKHLEKYSGVDPIVASERLHQIKEAAGLGPADNAIIGRTGDVYNPYTGERIGSLTQPQ
jgi:RHS repeat-associated protein